MKASLSDGTPVLFRPIRPGDKQMLAQGFAELSPGSRYSRFFTHLERLSESKLRYLTEVDGVNHSAWIAVLDRPGPERGIGVARWIRLPDEPEVAEGAVTVIDEFQGGGLGKLLLLVAARAAIENGIRAFRAWVQSDNRPVLEILRQLGAEPGKWESGVLQVTVPLPETVEDLDQLPAGGLLRAAAFGILAGGRAPGPTSSPGTEEV